MGEKYLQSLLKYLPQGSYQWREADYPLNYILYKQNTNYLAIRSLRLER